MSYIPPLDLICTYLGVDPAVLKDPKDETVTVKVELVHLFLRLVASGVQFDPEWYTRAHPDIGDAFSAGIIADLKEHFVSTGFFEGRLGAPEAIDEEWYLNQFPDVGKALRSGQVESVAEHYITVGKREWRAPRAEAVEELLRWRSALLK